MGKDSRFADRKEAGRRLAQQLSHLKANQPVVLGLARGGMVVAAEVAALLGAELDVLVARKLGAPWQPELAFGALAPSGTTYLDQEMVAALGLSNDEIERVVHRAAAEVQRLLDALRGGRPPLDVRDRTVIVVDDGLATGATAIAALRYLRSQGPKELVLAVPVCAAQAVPVLEEEADEVICAHIPRDLGAVGFWYSDFRQTSDEEVRNLLVEGLQFWEPPEPTQLSG